MLNFTLNDKKFTFNYFISINNFLKKNNINNNYKFAIINNIKLVNLNYIINNNEKILLISKYDFIYKKIINEITSFFIGFSIVNYIKKSYIINNGFDLNNSFYYDFFCKNEINIEIIDLIEKNVNFILKNKYIIKGEKIDIYKIGNKLNNSNRFILNKIKKIKNIDEYNIYYYKDYINILNINFFKIENIYLENFFKIDKYIYNIYSKKKNNIFNKRIYYYINNDFNNNNNENLNRDHRIINNYMEIFYINNEFPGMVFWKNNGLIIFNELKKLINEELKIYNYKEVITPILMIEDIWNKTEHMKYYKNNIFNVLINNKNYCMKPMNCPGHINVFNSNIKSYKDLPYRISEFGNCHRNELSGSLHGLMRTKTFFQDDGHIFCTINQINLEIINCIHSIYNIYSILGLNKIKVKLSTRPINKIGENDLWDISEKIMINILKKNNIFFEINYGEGAFYGPKIEFIFLDYSYREWQCGTIQLDFFISKKLNSEYIDYNNKKNNPIIIHRAILGSIERFIGIILEEFYGRLPTWLSPIQIVVISITNNQNNYINKIIKVINKYNIRYKVDIRNKKMEDKLRDNIILNIPYIFICGKIEEENNTISVRKRDNSINIFNIKNILKIIKKEIIKREI